MLGLVVKFDNHFAMCYYHRKYKGDHHVGYNHRCCCPDYSESKLDSSLKPKEML